MKATYCAIILGACIGVAAPSFSQTLVFSNQTIQANSEISGAGNAGLPDASGVLPAEFDLPPNATVFTMISATGTISLNGNGGQNDPDGVIVSGGYGLSLDNASLANAYGGISGLVQPGAGAISGLFEPDAAPAGDAPATLDFTVIGNNFTNFSPLLYQVFYVGDGLTGDGSGTVQQFNVPAGATRLFLGISDAPFFDGDPGAYGDNFGNFTVSFQITSAPVTLNIAGVTNSVILSWSTNLASYALQFTTNLSSDNWTNVAGLPGISGAQYVVTNDTSDAARFYRLKHN